MKLRSKFLILCFIVLIAFIILTFTLPIINHNVVYKHVPLTPPSNNTGAPAPLGFPTANIVAYVPITLTNSQNSAIAANTTIAIVFNAIQYQQYETPELNNSEFFFANGSVAYSWLQGNLIPGSVLYYAETHLQNGFDSPVAYLNASINTSASKVISQNALSTSNSVEWWVRIPTNSFLPAHSSNTLYLGWAGNTITQANILINGITTGEAPQLSYSYGSKDNGNRVFLYYSPTYNISNYGLGGDAYNSISFSKMQTPYGMTENVVNLSYSQFSGTTFIGMAWLRNITIYDNVVIEGWTPYWANGGQFSFKGNNDTSSYGYSMGPSPGGPLIYYNYYGDVNGNPISQNLTTTNRSFGGYNQYNWSWVYGHISGNFLSENIYPGPPNPFGGDVFLEVGQNVTNSTVGLGSYIGLGGHHYGGTNAYYYGVRARIYPPNGVMPSENYGNVIVNPSAFAVISQPSNATVDTGQYETFVATVTGGTPPYTYNFFAVNSENSSIVVNSISFSGVSGTTQSWTYPILAQYIKNSPIEVNVIVTSQNGNVLVSPYSPIAYTINPALNIPTISTSSSNSVDINQSINFSAYETNGTPPYIYNFIIYNSLTNKKIGSVRSTSNTVLWNVTGVNSGDRLVANVFVTDSASTPVTKNSTKLTTIFNVYHALSSQHLFPINASNLSSSHSLCAGAPGYNDYSDPGLRAGAIWLVENNYIRCFRMDIVLNNATAEGINAYMSKYYGTSFLGILDYATVDSYIRNKISCAYTACNWSSPKYNSWNLTDWNNTIKDALAQYPEIHSWEIWNEPDNYLSSYQNHSALNYFNLIKSAATIIHNEYPNDTVVCFGGDGGGGVYYNSGPYDWWKQVWNYGASQYCNAVSVHYDYTVPKKSFSSIWNLTHTPIWESEIGVSTSNQTQYIDYMIGDFNSAFSASPHFMKINWLCSLCPGFANWGLIQNYPYNLTPMLKAFVNYSNTYVTYHQLNLSIEAGQTIPFEVNVSGGRAPYSYNFKIYSLPNNNILASVITTANNFNYTIPTNVEGDSLIANVFVTDKNSMHVNSSFSDIIHVANNAGCGASCNPNLTMQSNNMVSGTINLINATPNPYTDKVNIMINGNVVASGAGRVVYNANTLPVGNYSIKAEDTLNGQYSIEDTLIVDDILSIPAPFPSSQSIIQGYNTTAGDRAIITEYTASGGIPPYKFNWLEKAPNSLVYTNSTNCLNSSLSSWGSETEFCQFDTNSLTTSGNYSFKLDVTDSGSNSIFSAPANITVKNSGITTTTTTIAPTTTIVSSSGGGGGGFGGGSGGGAIVKKVLPNIEINGIKNNNVYILYNKSKIKISGYNISNPDNIIQLTINRTLENYSGSLSLGLTYLNYTLNEKIGTYNITAISVAGNRRTILLVITNNSTLVDNWYKNLTILNSTITKNYTGKPKQTQPVIITSNTTLKNNSTVSINTTIKSDNTEVINSNGLSLNLNSTSLLNPNLNITIKNRTNTFNIVPIGYSKVFIVNITFTEQNTSIGIILNKTINCSSGNDIPFKYQDGAWNLISNYSKTKNNGICSISFPYNGVLSGIFAPSTLTTVTTTIPISKNKNVSVEKSTTTSIKSNQLINYIYDVMIISLIVFIAYETRLIMISRSMTRTQS